jgi:hypothetical protein
MNMLKRVCPLGLLVAVVACGGNGAPPDAPIGYRVFSHDAPSGEWVIDHHLNAGEVARITATCDFYKWADHEAVNGGCGLIVGNTFVPTLVSGKTGHDFVDVMQMGDKLTISTDIGRDRVIQQFSVKHVEVVKQ